MNQYVININKGIFEIYALQHLSHYTLKCYGRIAEPIWESLEGIATTVSNESCFVFCFLIKWNLMESSLEVENGE